MDYKLIAMPIVGAAIGYSTNWIAIKMLFRPYTEKKIFGFKVPFTPGLIPKERERVAKSIGEVFEEYLLTDRVIIDELLKDTTKSHILEFVNNRIYNDAGSINIEHIIQSDDNKKVINKLEEVISNKIVDLINEDTIKEKIQEVISDQIIQGFVNIKVRDIITDSVLEGNYIKFINNDRIENIITDYLLEILREDNKINNVLDKNIIESLKSTILYNVDVLMQELDVFNNENLKEKAIGLIDTTIKGKVGALGAMFVNAESIYESIAIKSKEKLQEPEVKENINSFINVKIDNFIDKPFSEILANETRENLVHFLAKYFINNLKGLNINSLIDINNKDISTIFNSISGKNFEEEIRKIVRNNFEELINNDKVINNINYLVSAFVYKIICCDIKINEVDKKHIDAFILSKYDYFINKQITELIKEVKLSKIIEKQINSFDIKMLEDIIISIAKKELNAITMLGGLLGFIISLLAAILY
ncbi:MAG: DUF445 family protein [Vallitalea sp.]|jgi:uncharacterized membrane protein YheB (UPF0754 family)|nr:DUF445 family protein [Vallitalea sp.]